jgi:hypothetical protein
MASSPVPKPISMYVFATKLPSFQW